MESVADRFRFTTGTLERSRTRGSSGSGCLVWELTLFLAQGIEDQLYSGRYPQLVVNSKQVIAHSMLAKGEPDRDFTVCEAVSHQLNDIFLSFGKQAKPVCVDLRKRCGIDQGL